ncbi:hypothetical protein BGX28_006090 [Mortierella sp. GBA30]|nr:hypothetical protein BGX28_006090 [Mortierella sp. GBA30]
MSLQPQFQQQDQQDQQDQQRLSPLIKNEPPFDPQQPYQSVPTYHQPNNLSHGQPYGGFQSSSSAASMNSFSALPPSQYNLNSHLMGLSMHHQQNSSSVPRMNQSSLAPAPPGSAAAATGMLSGNISGSTTPAMAYASAPSSPVMNNLQYNPSASSQYSQSGSSGLYQQHPAFQQQQQQHNSLTASFYPTSPQNQSQHLQYQQHQQQGSNSQFNAGPAAAPITPLRQQQQQQYAPLVPPLTDAQYAQYHQLLGSAFSSAASTPYHSNQSTPYSSMPTSPTLEYQQLSDPNNLLQKPKRRQVKNACVNCQKACKKCDEGRPCTRCRKYGLADTCVDSTRKVRKKGVKRGPYKRRNQPSQLGSASASTTPTLSHAVLPGGPAGYMSEPVTALNSPTQSHMLPFTSTTMGSHSGTLDFGYGNNATSSSSYSFHPQRLDNNYTAYTTSYSGPSLYTTPYNVNDYSGGGVSSSNNGGGGGGAYNNSSLP